MKKVVFALIALFMLSFVTACTQETTDEEIELFSPDKDKDEPIGNGG